MSVDRHEVRRIAALAKLRLEDEEADRLSDEMTRILEHAERLRASGRGGADSGAPLEASDGSGAASASKDPAAEAEPEPPGGPDRLHAAPGVFAPAFRDGFFLVPPPPGVRRDEG